MSLMTEQTLTIGPAVLSASPSLVGSALLLTDRETEAQGLSPHSCFMPVLTRRAEGLRLSQLAAHPLFNSFPFSPDHHL